MTGNHQIDSLRVDARPYAYKALLVCSCDATFAEQAETFRMAVAAVWSTWESHWEGRDCEE